MRDFLQGLEAAARVLLSLSFEKNGGYCHLLSTPGRDEGANELTNESRGAKKGWGRGSADEEAFMGLFEVLICGRW